MATFKLSKQKDVGFKDYLKVWRSNGAFETEDGKIETVSMEDALSHPNAPQLFPMTVETIVREAIEPILIGSSLLEQIQYTPGLQMASFPSSGAITADDIDESGEYPEYTISNGPGAQLIGIGKSGIACKFTDELLRYSQYDILGLYLRQMGRALARLKESKIWAMFSKMGVTTHDNASPNSSVFGTTTGYDYDGTANGSVTLDDIYEAYGQVLLNGFIPNALIVHPLTFTMFLTDPVMRSFALNYGGGGWMNGWQGSGQAKYPWSNGSLGKMGPGPAQENVNTNPVDLPVNAKMKLPSYFGMDGLKIIVSPFVPYNHVTKVTDLYMVDTNNIGALITDELPNVEEIPDRYHDLKKIKIRERYTVNPFNGGNAIAVIKNAKVTPNKLAGPTQITLAQTSFTPHNRSVAV